MQKVDEVPHNDPNNQQRMVLEGLFGMCKDKLGWKDLSGETVIEIGCGIGNISTELIITRFPSFKKLIATDVSEDLIRLAKSKNAHPNVEYFVADIQDESPYGRWFGTASKIISVSYLHWAKDQRKALQNVYNLMKPGAEACLIFAIKAPIFSAYEYVMEVPKWKEMFKDLPCGIPESHSKNLDASHFQKVFSDIGFDVMLCDGEMKTFSFPNEEKFKKFLSSVCPLMKYVPDQLKSELQEDLFEGGMKHISKLPDGQIEFRFTPLKAILRKTKAASN